MDIPQNIIDTATIINQFPNEKLDVLLDKINKIYEKKQKQSTLITVTVKLDDADSKAYQLIKLMLGKKVKDKDVIGILFADGLTVNTHIFLSAIDLVINSRKTEDDSTEEKD